MSDQTTRQEMVLPEACPKCGKPIRFLREVAVDVDMMVERVFVFPSDGFSPAQVEENGGEDHYPYVAAFDPDIPAELNDCAHYEYRCAECDEVLEGVSTSWFTFWNIRLNASDRSLLVEAIGAHLLDGCMTEDGTQQLLDIQRRLILMNQITAGEWPNVSGPNQRPEEEDKQ
jgi:hypothetical protein